MRGRKVSLRPVEARDHPLFSKWQNDPEIAHWMDYRAPFSLRDVAADQARARAEGHPFAVELDGRVIGKCGLNQIRTGTGTCALYVYIGDREVWGQGLGRDVVMALCSVAFDELEMERVELSMLSANARARRVYELCGFVVEPRRPTRTYRDGRWYETMMMSVDEATFAKVRAEYGI